MFATLGVDGFCAQIGTQRIIIKRGGRHTLCSKPDGLAVKRRGGRNHAGLACGHV